VHSNCLKSTTRVCRRRNIANFAKRSRRSSICSRRICSKHYSVCSRSVIRLSHAACVDIQEFYDDTLANERKSVDQKTYETQQVAARWENNGGPLAAFRAVPQPVRPCMCALCALCTTVCQLLGTHPHTRP
jgi:hypothetical protein